MCPVQDKKANSCRSKGFLNCRKALKKRHARIYAKTGYLSFDAGLTSDPERLVAVRGTLRERMATSPLLDHAGFTRNQEAAYRDM